MRWKNTLVIILITLAAAVAITLASPGARARFRANRVIYLKNANRYGEALEAFEQLRADLASLPAGVGEDFDRQIVSEARRYYLDLAGRPGGDAHAYEQFLAAIQQRERLAPLARRMRLEWMVRRDRDSSATLAAAREILTRGGYDPDALWWATLAQYDPRRPLAIPADLTRYRQQLENPGAAGPESGEESPSPERTAHILYLKALLALADRNWAAAADLLDQYESQATANPEPSELAHGLALLWAGRPEAATQVFTHQIRQGPAGGDTLAWLAQAWLAVPNYAWAAQAMQQLRGEAPEREAEVLKSLLGPQTEPAAGKDPFLALCAALGREGSRADDIALWSWLAGLAQDSPARAAVDAAAKALIAGAPLDPARQALLVEYGLWRNRLDLIQPLAAAQDAPTSGPATAASPLAPPTDEAWRQATGRLIQWYPARAAAQPPARPAQTQKMNLLLTRNATRRLAMTLPPGASMLVLTVQGYPARGIWPIVHVDLGAWGSKDFYAQDSRPQVRPLIIPLRERPAEPQKIEAAISLLNGNTGQEDRSVLIGEAYWF